MEKRRKALGYTRSSPLKSNDSSTPKKSKTRSGRQIQRKLEDNLNIDCRKESQSVIEPISTQHITPKRLVRPLLVRSPESPYMDVPHSPNSPEVEVSWDWSCSQVPKDMFPVKHVPAKTQPKKSPIVQSPLFYNHRVIRNRQMSEEENKERLAFYKNALAQALKFSRRVNPTSESHLEQEEVSKPKKPQHATSDPMCSLLDDSANEFMLECSQVIEERLRNGEINQGTFISIDISKPKHALSPDVGSDISNKRVCHGKPKLNLFPDNSKSVTKEVEPSPVKKPILSLRSPNSKLIEISSNDLVKSYRPNIDGNELHKPTSQLKDKIYLENSRLKAGNCLTQCTKGQTAGDVRQIKPTLTNRSTENTHHIGPTSRPSDNQQKIIHINNSTKYGKSTQGNSVNYGIVDTFHILSKGGCSTNQMYAHKNAIKTAKPLDIKHNGLVVSSSEGQKQLINRPSGPNERKEDRLILLLDDGFDTELSNLDFDSLCSVAQEHILPKAVCTREEIETKKRAAIEKLRKKMKT